ncbi:neurogenic locus notch homolog protein 1-like [Mizuhopecten yessoensis]|nr:neurogenic locus notch homolog protein 1-like [Mizuhopecten yessoensis]
MVETWSEELVDQVRYSYFTGGTEVAYTVFNGRGSDKSSWFSDPNIIYSKYTDISKSKVACGIDGDTNRKFTIHHVYNGCPNDDIWMQILDKRGGGAPCSWDQNVQTRPYFLYSAGTTVARAELGGNWNSAGFPAAETMGIFITGWTPVMKLAHGQGIGGGATDVRDLWKGTYTVNEGDADAMSIASGTKSYKSSIVDSWSDYYISAVRVSFVTGGKEKAFAVFDAHGADKNSWFTKARVLYSSWNDLGPTSTTNYDSIDGHQPHGRDFYMNRNYGGCQSDAGWFIVSEVASYACSWETKSNIKPYYLYSDAAGYELSDNQVLADVFVISVSMDMCNPNRCGNGATCIDLGTTYECACAGNYFGNNCQNLNGGFSSWSSYGSCTTTCGSGSKTRTRTCNNPSPFGSGASCAGSTTETASCNVQSCAIDGGWSSWSGWGSCTTTCGGGTQQKTRTCNNPSRQHGGADCPNNPSSATATQACNTASCPIDGGWSSWSGWGTCSVTCGGGTQQKTRSCTNPARQYGGADCPNSATASQSCNTHDCPIDGGWASWSSWDTCSVTCGGGSQGRTRTCTNPVKQYGGADCPNSAAETQACGTINCPIDGGWGNWLSWATCSVTCGGGVQSRTRNCDSPSAQYNGAQCGGTNTESQTCNSQACITNGGWSNWSAYGACTKTCGSGVYSRSRACDNPLPSNGGQTCSGSSSEFTDCNTQSCPAPQAGVYQQLCPSNWFTCESGGMTCIMLSMKCDCSNDCDDGSDETTGYAGCDAELMAMCESGAEHVFASITLLVVSLVFAAIFKNM